MKADRAREIAQDPSHRARDFGDILDRIFSRAKQGNFSTSLCGVDSGVVKDLQELGYKVTYTRASINTNRLCIKISWK